MTLDELVTFLKLYEQLRILYQEVSILSKKAPNDQVNIFKLSFINKLLIDTNQLLKEEYKPFLEFSSFYESALLPSNSDVTMMLAQYLRAMVHYKDFNSRYKFLFWQFWEIDGKPTAARVSLTPWSDNVTNAK